MIVKLNGNEAFRVTGSFGEVDKLHPNGHSGLDLAMDIGTRLNSPVDGIITKVVDYGSNNIGKGIIIETDSHERVIMGHLSDIKVSEGQSIHQGDLVALSGSTGRSTGGHLHLGMTDSNGQFINPEKLVNDSANNGGLWDFVTEWHRTGSFWEAMYGKSFFEVLKDFTWELLQDIYTFIITNGELWFILPAVIIMFVTFISGRNKFTKWIIPLWVGYFVTAVLEALNCLPPQ